MEDGFPLAMAANKAVRASKAKGRKEARKGRASMVATERARAVGRIETPAAFVASLVTGEMNALIRTEPRLSPTRARQLQALWQRVTLPVVQVARCLQHRLQHPLTAADLKFVR